jgi:hypothetical protein
MKGYNLRFINIHPTYSDVLINHYRFAVSADFKESPTRLEGLLSIKELIEEEISKTADNSQAVKS